MLTKNDLQAIKGIVKDTEKKLESKITRLSQKMDKIQKDVTYTRNFLDKQDIRNEKRIARIEEHLGFSEN